MSEIDIILTPEASTGSLRKDLWQYRELFFFLAWRDILVRYKQTVVGIAWSVLRPLLTMVVFTVVFGRLAGLPSGDTPYAVMVFSAMLPWQFFSGIFTKASNSLIANVSLVSKVYFPRLIIPATSVLVGLVDFAISFCVLLILMVIYGVAPDLKILLLPFLLIIAILTSLGAGFFISALNVKYRDFMHMVPFLVQLGLFVSPVAYSSSIVPEGWRLVYSLNPMVGVIDGFRWVLLGEGVGLYWPGFILSIVLSVVLFVCGLKYFMVQEREFADLI